MGRQRLPQSEVPELLARLDRAGASGVRRSPARFDGTVDVTWEDTAEEVQRYRDDMASWKAVYVVAAVSLVAMVLAIVLATLFGGA